MNVLADGISGKAIRIGGWQKLMTPGTTTFQDRAYTWQYPAAGNIDSKQGAVAFWVSPQDWDGTTNPDNKMFFHASCENDTGAFFVYKPSPDTKLFLYAKNGGNATGVTIMPINDWKKGDWHHIVFNWHNGQMDFFVDGVPVKSVSYPAYSAPFSSFCIGNVGFANETGGSLMDELKIFDAPLSPGEVKKLYLGNAHSAIKPEIGVGKRMDSAPEVDGVIQENEYSFSGTGFLTFPSHRLQKPQPEYALAHDGKRLYMAVKSLLPDNYQIAAQGRDTNLWEKESIEVHMDVPGRGQYQFIISPADSLYDSHNKDAQWNAQSVQIKSAVEQNVWSCELALDLKELGIAGEFGLNIARAYKGPSRNTCIAASLAAFGFCDASTMFKIRLLPQVTSPVSISRMNIGEDAFSVRLAAGSGGEAVNGRVGIRKGNSVVWERTSVLNGQGEEFVYSQPDGQMNGEVVLRDVSGAVLYQNSFALATEAEKPVTLGYLYTDIEKEVIKFVMNSMSAPEQRGSLKIRMMPLDGHTNDGYVRDYDLSEDAMHFTLDFPAASLPAGFYDITGILTSPEGTVRELFKEAWRKPEKRELPDYFSEEFIKIQPPWTPIEQNGTTVQCLGQTYDFNSGVLFRDVTSQGESLLRGPVHMELNGTVLIPGKKPEFENHGDYCKVRQSMKAGRFMVNTESRVDYDGMVKVKLRFAPTGTDCRIDSLRLVIPLNDSLMELVNGNSGGSGNGSGRDGLLTDQPWNNDLFRNYAFWAGNNEVGFSLVCSNTKGWHCSDTSRSLVLEKRGNTRTAVLNLVDTSFVLDKERTIEFAVMATPARPADPKVVRTRLCDWQMWSCNFSSYFDYPELPFLNDRSDAPNGFHYNAFGTSPHSPDWNYYHKLWHPGTMGAFSEDFPSENLAQRNRDRYVVTCFDSPTFLDFKIRQVQFVLSHPGFGAQNLYFDLLCWLGCGSADHGCAWKDDFGRLWGNFDWEGRRIYLQQARQALLAKNPEGLMSLHAHCQRIPMTLAYGDIHAGGEDFVGEVGQQGNYYGIISSEVLRSHSVPYGFGLKNLFIPQFERSLLFVNPGKQFDFDDPVNIKAMRHLLVMLFAHDIDAWYVDHEQAMIIWALQNEFGWDKDTVFVPKWKRNGLFKVVSGDDDGKLSIALYHREKRFLLACVNDTDMPKKYVVDLDMQRLIGKAVPKTVRDVYNLGRNHAVSNGRMMLELAPREAMILWIE
ncbi:MAG: hypothetical protein J6S21_06605 [Victivallales bacterium]|nr:hypothetical protein [Victivallales bacterium]